MCLKCPGAVTQNLKDAIVVTAAGAEALPFLASFCVLPASLLFFFAYGTQPTSHPVSFKNDVTACRGQAGFPLTNVQGSGAKTVVLL